MDRQEIIASLNTRPPTVLILGGGINGIGTFRDLALNGIDVLLIDQADFCSGASAASSHMAHGGIRYLENGEFRLVREAVRERNRLIENAPHLVKPLATTIPIFKIFSGLLNAPFKFLGLLEKPSERGALVIKIGLIFYDAFTRSQKTVPFHRLVGRKKTLAEFPDMDPDIRYAATYYDGSILSPERLSIELLLDGEAEGEHARALNYFSVRGVEGNCIQLRDELSGLEYEVSPRLVINATGPWIDLANLRLGLKTHYIGGTKGSHLVLDNPALSKAIAGHEIFFENKDGRIVLIFPLGDKVLIGTSDLSFEDPEAATCSPAEVDYFIGMVQRVFPGIKVEPSQIIFRFSGVRPLAYTQAKIAGQITRDHHIHEDLIERLPVLSLVGGKWTTFRAFAEQVTDKVFSLLDFSRTAGTHNLPIGGGGNYPTGSEDTRKWLENLEKETGLPTRQLETLFNRYGTRSRLVCAHLAAGKDTRLVSNPDFSQREILYLVQNEKVVHLDDLLLRRTLLAFLGGLSLPLIVELADISGSFLGWDDGRKQKEINQTLAILAQKHGVKF